MSPSPILTGTSPIALCLNAPLIGMSRRWPRVLHAIPLEGISIRGDKGHVSACGKTGLRFIKLGDAPEPTAAPWPPPARGFDAHERCRDCWESTGRMRPRVAIRRAS